MWQQGFLPANAPFSSSGTSNEHQEKVPRPAALAWERAAFAEVFDHDGPGERIRRFLEKA